MQLARGGESAAVRVTFLRRAEGCPPYHCAPFQASNHIDIAGIC
jgi:hypothetical protein